jgi:hypothetical protein
MSKIITALVLFFLSSHSSLATTASENQANSFANIYANTCLKYLNNLDALRTKLKPIPKLPPEKAALFLNEQMGDAWPIPDKYGTFVLSILSEKNFCAVYLRKADVEMIKKQFERLVAKAPAPLVTKMLKNEQIKTKKNDIAQRVSYEWFAPNAQQSMLFMLTTVASESADLQVLATASLTTK